MGVGSSHATKEEILRLDSAAFHEPSPYLRRGSTRELQDESRHVLGEDSEDEEPEPTEVGDDPEDGAEPEVISVIAREVVPTPDLSEQLSALDSASIKEANRSCTFTSIGGS